MSAFFIAIPFATNDLTGETGMTLNEIMSSSLITVEMDDSFKVLKEIFENTSIHHILVVEQHTLLVIISDRYLLKSITLLITSSSDTSTDCL